MVDIVVNDQESTSVVETATGDIVVTTVTGIDVVSTPETATVVAEQEITSVITNDQVDTVVVEQASVQIITEGIQGPAGPQGPAGVSGATVLTLEAGEDLAVGDPVYVLVNKFYVADNLTNFRVIGVISTAAVTGSSATATIMGPVTLSGLTANSPYFLGSGIITGTAPASGYVIRMGQAVSASTLLLNIEEPVLLT